MSQFTGYVLLHCDKGSASTEREREAHQPAHPPQRRILKASLHTTGRILFNYEAASVPRPDAALIASKALR
jgi:hypothetical protein